MDGHATLQELQNAPPGTVFKERRYCNQPPTLSGRSQEAEFRSMHRALPPGPKHQTTADMQARLAAIEEQTRELERLAELLEG
jgi:hypothetical protein